MASTNTSNAALFGDSSDEDEVMNDAPASTEAPAESAPAEADDKPDEEAAAEAPIAKPSNANLFGDDSSDEDDEFNDDGIVGKSASDGAVRKEGGDEVKKPQTMSERLGELCLFCVMASCACG
jgi:hypothetical protein